MKRGLVILIVSLCVAAGGYALMKGSQAQSTEGAWTAYSPEGPDVIRVLIFAEKPDALGETDEQMADWAGYLNDFSASDETIEITFEEASVCKELTDNNDGCDEPYSTLFLNEAGEAYFYEGVIVEPQVYDHARAALRGEELSPMLKAFASDAVSLK